MEVFIPERTAVSLHLQTGCNSDHQKLNISKVMTKRKKILPMYSENEYGMIVKRCCASCEHKALTGKLRYRKCMKHLCKTKAHNVCSDWAMSEQMKLAGTPGDGRVKRKEYQMFLMSVREAERLAEKQGQNVQEKEVEEIRALFEQEHGSIYINI